MARRHIADTTLPQQLPTLRWCMCVSEPYTQTIDADHVEETKPNDAMVRVSGPMCNRSGIARKTWLNNHVLSRNSWAHEHDYFSEIQPNQRRGQYQKAVENSTMTPQKMLLKPSFD
ncbi:hypothetical protein CIB48_g1721 [Xylaria polymorpha]|nr:hypothetical protein CIB48_g1721 [Xylaria polymorpha]